MGVCCDANKCSCFYKGFVNRSEHAYEPVRRWLDEGMQVSDLLRSSVSWPWTGYILSRIRSTSNWATVSQKTWDKHMFRHQNYIFKAASFPTLTVSKNLKSLINRSDKACKLAQSWHLLWNDKQYLTSYILEDRRTATTLVMTNSTLFPCSVKKTATCPTGQLWK